MCRVCFNDTCDENHCITCNEHIVDIQWNGQPRECVECAALNQEGKFWVHVAAEKAWWREYCAHHPQKFKVGDRIRVLVAKNKGYKQGRAGTVTTYRSSMCNYLVEFDNPSRSARYTLGFKCDWFFENEIEILGDKKKQSKKVPV